jgi:hypothetical protein
MCMKWKNVLVGYWFAVSMVSSLMMKVGRTIGFPMKIMTLKQGCRTHAQIEEALQSVRNLVLKVGTPWQINEEFHIQSIVRKRLDQWAQSRRAKDAHARRDAARTVDARRKVWGATVDVSAMGTVVRKECEGDVWVTLGYMLVYTISNNIWVWLSNTFYFREGNIDSTHVELILWWDQVSCKIDSTWVISKLYM